jgi:hypothetical protein
MAGLELVDGVEHVLNLRTGEMLVLSDAALDDLAEARLALGELWHTRTTAAMMVDAELVQRADRAALAGEDFGRGARFRVFVDRGHARQYDSNAIRSALLQAVNRGELRVTLGAIERLFVVTQYRLDLKHWRDLEKNALLDAATRQRLTEIVEAHSTPKRRGVKIEPRDVVEGTATELPRGAAA